MALGNVDSIVLKHSLTVNDRPTPAELRHGELAINANANSIALYTLDSAGAVQEIKPGAGATTHIHPPSATAPTGAVRGELWVDTSPVAPNPPELKMYDGTSWMILAKADGVTIKADATSGALAVSRVDMGTFSALLPIAAGLALLTLLGVQTV